MKTEHQKLVDRLQTMSVSELQLLQSENEQLARRYAARSWQFGLIASEQALIIEELNSRSRADMARHGRSLANQINNKILEIIDVKY